MRERSSKKSDGRSRRHMQVRKDMAFGETHKWKSTEGLFQGKKPRVERGSDAPRMGVLAVSDDQELN